MTLLSPLGLLGLLSLPVLLWLWRRAASQRQVRVPSLIPFERLLRRAPPQRTHLVVNLLFWLQLAALLGATAALIQPVLFLPRTKTILVILDTSASMGSRQRGPASFAQAVSALRARLARKAPSDQVFVMTTAPAAALLPQPTSDGTALINALHGARVAHLGGNLSTAARIGRSLLGRDPEDIWVATDEPRPAAPLAPSIHWLGVGGVRPNVAIAGVDTKGTFCRPAEAQFLVMLQNYSADPVRVSVRASHGGRRVAHADIDVPAHGRAPAALTLPERTQGLVHVSIDARGDSLEADNHAWLTVPRTSTLPVLLQVARADMARTMSAWLGACTAIAWTAQPPAEPSPALVITNGDMPAFAVAALLLNPPAQSQPILSHWLVTSDHPIGAYLPSAGVVSAALDAAAEAPAGLPVVSGLVGGRRVPIIVADERAGRRIVTFHVDVSGHEATPALLVAFFNSLQWLMGHEGTVLTGTPMSSSGWSEGTVTIRRPDDAIENVLSHYGVLTYTGTSVSGLYELAQGRMRRTIPVNFVDSLESNMVERPSTWTPLEPLQASAGTPARRPTMPLSPPLLLVVLVMLAVEWWMYSRKGAWTRQ